MSKGAVVEDKTTTSKMAVDGEQAEVEEEEVREAEASCRIV